MIRTLFKTHRRLCIFAAVLLLLVLLSLVFFCVYRSLAGSLRAQYIAEEFRGENEARFSQVSCFFPVGSAQGENEMYSFRRSLESAYVTASLEAPETGSLYKDAWSATAEITVTGNRGSASVKTIGIGGDYFAFHPLYLRDGGYIAGSDLMHDRVVLDEGLAWKLFGGIELEGMTVQISGETYLIAGVISREDDFADKKAYSYGDSMYMAYDKLADLTEAEISCYELVSADPISGFALEQLETGFPDGVCVENTRRYSIGRTYKVMGDFGKRSMNTAAVIYPYWENAARLVEDWCALALLLSTIFIALPFLAVITVAIILIRRGSRRFKSMVPVWIDRYREKQYEKKCANKKMLAAQAEQKLLAEQRLLSEQNKQEE